MSAQVNSFCLHRDGYSVVNFPKELCKAHLAEIREAGELVVADLANHKSPQCIVDLTNLDYLGSSMVASIVRIWKAIDSNQGRMIVAASSKGVREVLNVTGLSKVWTIKSSYEHAVHELGFSPEAKVVKRELRLLAFVGPATFLVGGVAAALCRVPKLASLSQPHEFVALSLIGLAVITSGISVFRERSWRRWLSVIVFLGSVALLSYLIWTFPKTKLEDNGKAKSGTVKSSEDGSEGDKAESEPGSEPESDSTEMDQAPSDAESADKSDKLPSLPSTPPGVTAEGSRQRPQFSGEGSTNKPAAPEATDPNKNTSNRPSESDDPDDTKSNGPSVNGPVESGNENPKPAVEKP